MKEPKELKVKYFVPDLEELRCVPGSDWVDLRAAEDVTLAAGEFRLIPLGIAVALPEGCEAHVVPRSSTFKNYGLLQANSMGVVDGSYRGDGDQWRLRHPGRSPSQEHPPLPVPDRGESAPSALHPGGAPGGPGPGRLRLHGGLNFLRRAPQSSNNSI